MGSAWDTAGVKVYAYRYNQPDPATGSSATEHGAENYIVFRGTHTGYVLVPSLILRIFEQISNIAPMGQRRFRHSISEIVFSEELIAYSVKHRNSIILNGAPAGTQTVARLVNVIN